MMPASEVTAQAPALTRARLLAYAAAAGTVIGSMVYTMIANIGGM